jgi:hydrophobe/amphiphile efflux-1 (HAE1) family protein
MNTHFTDTFIKRPVFATVLSLILLLVGLASYFSLTTRLFPKMNMAVVEVTISYPGADAELIEGFVTTPVENALAGVDGIDYFTSSSTQGVSEITIHFKLGYDINVAISDVNAKIAAARATLPPDIRDPIIRKEDPGAQATMYLSFNSHTMAAEAITDYLNRVVQPQLQTLPGVAKAEVWGRPYAMRIWFNPQMMAAHGVTANDLKKALLTQSLQAPSGQIESSTQVFNVKTFSEFATSAQFNRLVIKNSDGHLTRISDIGRAELGTANDERSMFINGQASVMMGIYPASNANPLDISTVVNKIIPQIKQNLPKETSFSLVWDSSKFIAESIKEVKKTVIEATMCVVLVVFLFLGSWRTLLIPLVTIPLSLIGVCAVMLAMGYSLNIITFLAFVLAIGMVVDDAIVVAENTHRHMLTGKSRIDAAIIGTREIQFAIIAMTFTLAAVYAPIGFMSGLIGALFKEFAFTLSGAVIISGFIALTLSPMMCSKVMVAHAAPGSFADKVDKRSEQLMRFYRTLLTKVLHKKKWVVLALPVILGLSAIIYKVLPDELVPGEDFGAFFTPVQAPTSATLAYTEKHIKQLGPIFYRLPEVENTLAFSGMGGKNQGVIITTLKPWSERKRSPAQIIAAIMPEVMAVSGVQAFPMEDNALPIYSAPIELVVQTTGSYYELHKTMQELEAALRANPLITNARSDLKIDQLQLNVSVDRNKAGDLGVAMKDIGDTINLALGKPIVGRFGVMGRGYEVIPQLDQNFREHPHILNNLYVNTAFGGLVPLSQLITIQETLQPHSLHHFQQLRSATLSAALASGYTQGEALEYLQKLVKKIVPAGKGLQVSYSGLSRQYFEAGNQMTIIFAFAIIFIFLVLAAQFESFRDPFIVLFSIPLSTFGALLALWLTGNTINIYSQIGLVTLVGLISKHGILMVEFANQLRRAGEELEVAIVKAATIRLRPILMTTSAIVIGALPLAFASGASAASRQQIGWVIIGGMLIGTLFTLFVVPTIYIYLAARKRK